MKAMILIQVLAITASAFGQKTPERVIEPVKLADSAPLVWDAHKNETVDATRIVGPTAIKLTNSSEIVISSCELSCIEIAECKHITIRNCWIHDSAKCGITLYKSTDVMIQGCRFEQVSSGVYAIESQQIQVIGNFARNVVGPFPRGQMTQFDNVTGAGNVIRGNYAINDSGKSKPEDVINLYQSHGEKDSPILIEDNYVTGDSTKGSEGKSENGSGIMLGDCGGAYLTCRHNVIIAAGQVGLGVAGGTHIRVEDNLVFGGKSNVSNAGMYVWNQSKKPSSNVTILRNRVQWINKDGEDNSWWDGGGATAVEEKDNHFADGDLAAALPPPPSAAPMPPMPFGTTRADGKVVVRLPWKPE